MFLTLEDHRARIKGSRDPLGVQPIWAHFGRRVVCNLTTVTTSVRGFTVLMLGRWWCERLLDKGRIGEEAVLGCFLRWEQVGAHARYARNGREEGRILGIERVERFGREGRGKVAIEDGQNGRILSDQKTYGLWGLYTVAARTSGMVADGPVGLTPLAREHLERLVVPRIEGVLGRVEGLVHKGGTLDVREGSPIVEALGDVLSERFEPAERDFYARVLRDAELAEVDLSARGRQARMRELLERHTELDQSIGRDEIERMLPGAEALDPGLARALQRILMLEAVLAPAEVLFGHLQARGGQTVRSVAREIEDRWGRSMPYLDVSRFRELRGEVEAQVGPDIWLEILRVVESLVEADYAEAIGALLRWNELVMRARGAAAWVRTGEGGKVDVRYRGTETELPAGSKLPGLWRNSYFIPSLKVIARQLQEDDA